MNLKTFFKHPPSRSIGLIFGINGMVFGTWITRIPEIKNALSLSDSDLGLALFGVPLGALIIMPLMGRITAKLGAGRSTLWCAYLLCLTIFFPAIAFDLVSLTVALAIFGVIHGGMDIAMNATAATIEQEHKINIMSTCHGFWSLGGMIGATTGSLAYGWGLPFISHLAVLCSILFFCSVTLGVHLRPIKFLQTDEPLFALPTKALLILALIGFCSFFAEGAIADWSAVYMRDELHADEFLTGIAYAGFSLTMAIGRFYGDDLIAKIGPIKIVKLGAFLATISIGILVAIAHPIAAIIGFAISGIGFATIVPVVFSEAAKVPGMVPGASIAAVGSMGYFGLLVGPPCLGFIAEVGTLSIAMAFIACLCAAAMGLSFLSK